MPPVNKQRVLQAASKEEAEAQSLPEEIDVNLSLDENEQRESHIQEKRQHELQEAKDTHRLRLGYAGRIFWLVCVWLVYVAIVLFISGFKTTTSFSLSDNVLIAFITSTTVTVVGLFVVVAKWMFPDGNNKKSST